MRSSHGVENATEARVGIGPAHPFNDTRPSLHFATMTPFPFPHHTLPTTQIHANSPSTAGHHEERHAVRPQQRRRHTARARHPRLQRASGAAAALDHGSSSGGGSRRWSRGAAGARHGAAAADRHEWRPAAALPLHGETSKLQSFVTLRILRRCLSIPCLTLLPRSLQIPTVHAPTPTRASTLTHTHLLSHPHPLSHTHPLSHAPLHTYTRIRLHTRASTPTRASALTHAPLQVEHLDLREAQRRAREAGDPRPVADIMHRHSQHDYGWCRWGLHS